MAPSDTLLVVVSERIRVVIEHQREKTLDSIAESLLLEPDRFRQLIEEPYGAPDRAFVLDTIASLAYCQGVDPFWLLTGRYDPALHRHVLSLSEERGSGGLDRVRAFVQEHFERVDRNTPPFSFPGFGPSDSG